MKFTHEDAEMYYKIFPRHVNNHYLIKRKIFLEQFIKNEDRILDVGCGTGKLLSILPNTNKYGIDNSKAMIAVGRKKSKFVISNSYQIPFNNDSFNLVYTIATLHHLVLVSKVRKTINEMLRVTKKGGHVIIWDHNPKNPYWRIAFKKAPWDKNIKIVDDSTYIKILKCKDEISSIKILKKGFVPDFCPKILLSIFQLLEKIIENSFLGNFFAAHTVVIIKK